MDSESFAGKRSTQTCAFEIEFREFSIGFCGLDLRLSQLDRGPVVFGGGLFQLDLSESQMSRGTVQFELLTSIANTDQFGLGFCSLTWLEINRSDDAINFGFDLDAA